MIDYPANLPLPDFGTYTGTVNENLIRTSFLTSAPNQIVGFNSPTTLITMTISMTNDQWVIFSDFLRQISYNWFWMPVVSPKVPVNILSKHRVRFVSDVQYAKRGDNWLSATLTAEMIPGDANDPLSQLNRTYDFIIAGTPASPAPDRIIAERSSPFITASLYKYEGST